MKRRLRASESPHNVVTIKTFFTAIVDRGASRMLLDSEPIENGGPEVLTRLLHVPGRRKVADGADAELHRGFLQNVDLG